MAGHVEPLLLRHGQVRHPGVLDLAQPEVLDQGVYSALGVPGPGEGAGLPEEGVEEEGLPDRHVRAKLDVLLHKGDPPFQPLRTTSARVILFIIQILTSRILMSFIYIHQTMKP